MYCADSTSTQDKLYITTHTHRDQPLGRKQYCHTVTDKLPSAQVLLLLLDISFPKSALPIEVDFVMVLFRFVYIYCSLDFV